MNIVIWGTGEYGSKAVAYIKSVNKEFGHEIFHIESFVDSSENRIGKLYYGKKICAPIDVMDAMNLDFRIVIAVKKNEAIVSELQEAGIEQYFTFYDFCIREKALMEIVCSKHEIPKEKNLLGRIKGKYRFERLRHEGGTYSDTKRVLGYSACIASMASFYGTNIKKAAVYTEGFAPENNGSEEHGTIAMYHWSFSNGGVQRVISLLLTLFISRGYKVVLITEENEGPYSEYDCQDEVMHYRIPRWEWSPYQWIESVDRIIREEHIRTFVSHMSTHPSNFFLGLLCKECGVRFLVELHSRYTLFNDDIEYVRCVFSYTDKLIVLSRTDASYWHTQGFSACYIPDPVIVPEHVESRMRSDQVILWIGRLSPEKNVMDAIDIIKKVIERIPDVQLYIVGAPANEDILKTLTDKISQLQLEKNVRLCGFDPDVDKYYQEASVMMMTSSWEGFSMTISESKGFAVPLVLYELPYLEILADKKGYVAVHQRDKEAMAYEVIKILKNEHLRMRLSEEARESIIQFAKTDVIAAWESVLWK